VNKHLPPKNLLAASLDAIERSRQEITWFRQVIILTNRHIAESEASMAEAMQTLKEASQYFDSFDGSGEELEQTVPAPPNPVT